MSFRKPVDMIRFRKEVAILQKLKCLNCTQDFQQYQTVYFHSINGTTFHFCYSCREQVWQNLLSTHGYVTEKGIHLEGEIFVKKEKS